MYDVLKSKMNMFSIYELRDFLGNDVEQLLAEWLPEGRTYFSKHEYIEILLSVKGIEILKDDKFRAAIIDRLSDDELIKFRDVIRREDCGQIREDVKNVQFGRNKIILKLLEILNIEENYLFSENCALETVNTLDTYDQFYDLLDYQYVVKQQILNELNSPIELNSMLVHMPTGTGKTKTMMHTIVNYFTIKLKNKGLIIWIAHTQELLNQAYETFSSVWKHLGHGEVNAYKLWGDSDLSNNENLNGIMFCGRQKLDSISNNNIELFNKLINCTDLIVFDEAHMAAANRTRQLINSFMVKKDGMKDRALVGLTATPGRTTHDTVENNILSNLFGGKIIEINPRVLNYINLPLVQAENATVETDIIKYFQERRILSKIIKEELEYESTFTDEELEKIRRDTNLPDYEKDYSNEALKIFGMNKSRNKAILNRLCELNRDNIPTIVFACSVKHAKLLSAILNTKNIHNALVIGDMKTAEREEAIRNFKDRNNDVNIIINFGVLTTGFDSTNIKCVFITRPTKSVVLYSQMIGRGLRGPQMGGNEECLLIDVQDNLAAYDEHAAFNHFENYWN